MIKVVIYIDILNQSAELLDEVSMFYSFWTVVGIILGCDAFFALFSFPNESFFFGCRNAFRHECYPYLIN